MKTIAFLMLVSAPSVTLTPDQVAALQAHIAMLEQAQAESQAAANAWYRQYKECRERKQF